MCDYALLLRMAKRRCTCYCRQRYNPNSAVNDLVSCYAPIQRGLVLNQTKPPAGKPGIHFMPQPVGNGYWSSSRHHVLFNHVVQWDNGSPPVIIHSEAMSAISVKLNTLREEA